MNKQINERRAEILGFNCYCDITTGDIRSAGSEAMDWVFTIVLLLFYFKRWFMRFFFCMEVSYEIKIHADENEKLMDMGAKIMEILEGNDGKR